MARQAIYPIGRVPRLADVYRFPQSSAAEPVANSRLFLSTGPQTIAPPLFTNSQTFFSGTVAAGPVTITQSARFDDGDTFYSATVSQAGADQTLTQSVRFDDGEAFYSPTVTQPPVVLLPAFFDDGDTFFAPTVTRGTVNLAPARYDDGDTFYSLTVTLGPPADQTLFPSINDDGDTFFTASVTTQGTPAEGFYSGLSLSMALNR